MALFLEGFNYPMRNLLIISLISIHLIGNTEFSQLLHIPYLAIHYYHHLQTADKIAFSDFVSAHYGKGDGIQTDDQEERQLPFMQVHQQAFSIAIIPATLSFYAINTASPSKVKAQKHFFYQLPAGYFGTVLKPPRYIA
jgi:hypothetical protein